MKLSILWKLAPDLLGLLLDQRAGRKATSFLYFRLPGEENTV